MSVTPAPTHAVVKYQSPSERAYSAAGKTALGLVIALLIPLVSLGVKYLVTGDFSHTAFVALLTAAGVAAGGVLVQFLLKLQSAISDNIPPTVTADGAATPAPSAFIHGEVGTLTALDTGPTLADLLAVMDVLRQWSAANAQPAAPPEPPPATIAHRVVTSTPPILSADAAVRRSHHAAKVPVTVPSVDTVSDS
jgi:hypothetical protein